MADREGGDITGHNLPEVVGCDIYYDKLLMPEHRPLLVEALNWSPNQDPHKRRSVPEDPLAAHIRRLLKDCYICVYVRPTE